MLIENIRPSRRAFLAGSAGLVVGFYLAPLGPRARRARAQGGRSRRRAGHAVRAERLRAHRARRHGDASLCKHIEMGQGPYTGLTTIVAEELDADWSQMRAVAVARQRRALQEPRLRHAWAPAARPPSPTATTRCAGRRHGARHAGRRRGRRNGACRQARSPWRAAASATPHRAAKAASARSPRRRPRSCCRSAARSRTRRTSS